MHKAALSRPALTGLLPGNERMPPQAFGLKTEQGITNATGPTPATASTRCRAAPIQVRPCLIWNMSDQNFIVMLLPGLKTLFILVESYTTVALKCSMQITGRDVVVSCCANSGGPKKHLSHLLSGCARWRVWNSLPAAPAHADCKYHK